MYKKDKNENRDIEIEVSAYNFDKINSDYSLIMSGSNSNLLYDTKPNINEHDRN